MKDEFILAFKVRGLTEKQQTEIVMTSRSIAKRIKPEGRFIVGLERKGGREK